MLEHLKQLIDPSSGLRNYYAFKEDIKKEFTRTGRYDYWSSLALINIEGEDLLFSELVQLLQKTIRGSDTIYRIVDRKIGIIMPHTLEEGALSAMARFERLYKENVLKKFENAPEISTIVICFNGNEFIDFAFIINTLEKELIFKIEIDKIRDIFEGLKEPSRMSKIYRKEKSDANEIHKSLRTATHKLNNQFQVMLGKVEVLLLTIDESDDLHQKISAIRKEIMEASSTHQDIFRLIRLA